MKRYLKCSNEIVFKLTPKMTKIQNFPKVSKIFCIFLQNFRQTSSFVTLKLVNKARMCCPVCFEVLKRDKCSFSNEDFPEMISKKNNISKVFDGMGKIVVSVSFRHEMSSICKRKLPQIDTELSQLLKFLWFFMQFLYFFRDFFRSSNTINSTTKKRAWQYFFAENFAAFCFKKTSE